MVCLNDHGCGVDFRKNSPQRDFLAVLSPGPRSQPSNIVHKRCETDRQWTNSALSCLVDCQVLNIS